MGKVEIKYRILLMLIGFDAEASQYEVLSELDDKYFNIAKERLESITNA